ncbi:MAG: SGNH/GDSL hydrolase family protein [Endomicrobiaceae bacterium]|nr:SGNH/GDSL hydrolase family protein [Endomicrobiaceae bacterium]
MTKGIKLFLVFFIGLFLGCLLFLFIDILFENIEKNIILKTRDLYTSDEDNFSVSSDKILVYEMKKNTVFKRYKFLTQYKTNGQGFRDADFELNKNPNSKLIIALGDSITFAGSVGSDKIYTKRLSKKIDKKDTRYKYRVYNMGVDGYNIIQAAHNLKINGLKYKPDTVVFLYCLNDNDEHCSKEIYYAALSGSNKINKFLCRSKAYREIYKIVLNKLDKENSTNVAEIYRKYANIDNSITNDEIGFYIISKLQKEYGFKCYIFIVPYFDNSEEKEMQKNVKNILKKYNNIICVDLHENFIKASEDFSVFREDIIHPNSYGHKLLSDFIYEKLDQDGVLQ